MPRKFASVPILLLNGFMKKSTKDYKKEIEKAQHILDTYYEKED